MDDFRAKLIQKECEAWSCWNDLSPLEQEEVFEGYQNIFNAGAEWQRQQTAAERASVPGEKND